MVFASPAFLFLFLPATLALYLVAPRRARNAVLLLASALFYLWGEGRYLALLAASTAGNWGFGLVLARTADAPTRKRWLAAAIAANLAVLAVFKYANFAFANVNALAPVLSAPQMTLPAIALPLGISFFTFHAISYVVDVHRGNAPPARRLREFALYMMLFPQLIAGPIIRWRDIAAQLGQREARLADFAFGVRRFVLGLGKKVLIANAIGPAADRIFGLPPSELTAPLAWLGLVCYTLQIYFDFSGYSDMAIGLMRMFGFRILENFNYPYIAQSVREFWRRWHISLSNWFRDYLYVPLGGNRRGGLRTYVNLAIVFLLCGFWHGASWTFVVWGAWHGLFLIAERAGADGVLARMGRLRHVYALIAVMGGWVLFRCDTLAHARAYYEALLGGASASTARQPVALFIDPLLATTLAVAVVGATPLARRLGGWRDDASARGVGVGRVVLSLDLAWLALVLVAAASCLAAGTYNPFIYFRF